MGNKKRGYIGGMNVLGYPNGYKLSEEECKEGCLQNADCKSIDYIVYGPSAGLCTMNSVTSAERPDRFYSSISVHYWEKVFQ